MFTYNDAVKEGALQYSIAIYSLHTQSMNQLKEGPIVLSSRYSTVYIYTPKQPLYCHYH